jgi:membrane-bound ClpP family serine protease
MADNHNNTDNNKVVIRGSAHYLEEYELPAERSEFIDDFWERLSPFLHNPALAGVLLMIATSVALVWANSAFSTGLMISLWPFSFS